MDVLNTKIENILTEKTLKIRPENIKSGVNILGINGSVIELQGETKTVNPSTSQQTITPSTGKNGITQVTVGAVTSSIDNNIQAGNIKDGVQILGVTGTYEGQQPTGTISITENGTVDVSQYASAEVNVSGGGGDYNAKFKTSSLVGSKTNWYYRNIEALPSLDFSDKTSWNFDTMFGNWPSLKSIEGIILPNTATTINSFFYNDTSLEYIPVINLSNITEVSNALYNCINLTDEALNNLLASCITGVNVKNKTLSYFGLTQTQREKCQTLSNYQAFVNAGWTTG